MQATVRSGQRAKGIVEVIGKDGKLVYRSHDRTLFRKYEAWRTSWATQYDNRALWMPSGFREGAITPLTIGFWLYLCIFKKSIYRRLIYNG